MRTPTIYYRITNKISDFPRDIKSFIQRGRRGYADNDCWDIDNYLADIIPKMLKTMIDPKKGGGHTYPGTPGDSNIDTARHWNTTVRKMIAGFQASVAQDDLMWSKVKDFKSKNDKLEKTRLEGMTLFVKYFNSLWD